MKHRTKLYSAIIYDDFRQKNKQFYNYTLYMTVSVFNKYSLDNCEYNTTPIPNDQYLCL